VSDVHGLATGCVPCAAASGAEPARSSWCSKRSRYWRHVPAALEVFCILKSASRPSRVMRRCPYLQYLDLFDATDQRIHVFLLGGKSRRCWCLKSGGGVVGGVFVGLCGEVKARENVVPAASP
jgi:hypothetical protein